MSRPETAPQGASRGYPRLFSPGRIGSLTLPNRILMAPMEKNLANPDGTVTQPYIDYVVERVRGGAALISPESLFVHPAGKGNDLQLGISRDIHIPGLRRLCRATHAEGAFLMAEINHGGRQSSSWVTGLQPVAPSPLPFQGTFRRGDLPRELSAAEIPEVVRLFARAALRAAEAGFDAVQVHGAHGHLVNQFLSPRSNRREDAYGGDAEGRMRFPLDVVAAVREALGPGFPLSYRISADEGVEGGLPPEEMLAFCEALERARVDLIDVSGGTYYESADLMTPSMVDPLARHVPWAQRVKARVSVPVSVAGRIMNGDEAEEILRSGRADFVVMGRALHADPHLPRKTREGRAGEVRPCLSCLKCSDLLIYGKPVLCTMNTLTGQEREARLRPAREPKRVLVVGGGPGGLEAARVAALRGHRVTLWEMSGEMGGQFRYAAMAPGRADLGLLIRFLEAEARALGVEIRPWTLADAEAVRAFSPEEVILAAGALAGPLEVPGEGAVPCADPLDVMANGWAGEGRALVVGGSMRGCAVAGRLAECGGEVVIVEVERQLSDDMGHRARHPILRSLLGRKNVRAVLRSTLEGLEEGKARIRDESGGETAIEDLRLVVPVRRMVPRNRLMEDLARACPNLPVRPIGDCCLIRDAFAAVHTGADAARKI